mmetsp:Transcript_67457/g.180231  ORF Transcript_67457/g.180231 Transcript_67457/m.180231 type:complete len:107 (+) Transcript_67457:332-652(+)
MRTLEGEGGASERCSMSSLSQSECECKVPLHALLLLSLVSEDIQLDNGVCFLGDEGGPKKGSLDVRSTTVLHWTVEWPWMHSANSAGEILKRRWADMRDSAALPSP